MTIPAEALPEAKSLYRYSAIFWEPVPERRDDTSDWSCTAEIDLDVPHPCAATGSPETPVYRIQWSADPDHPDGRFRATCRDHATDLLWMECSGETLDEMLLRPVDLMEHTIGQSYPDADMADEP